MTMKDWAVSFLWAVVTTSIFMIALELHKGPCVRWEFRIARRAEQVTWDSDRMVWTSTPAHDYQERYCVEYEYELPK